MTLKPANSDHQMVLISRKRLAELEYSEGLLQAMQADGVDNWESGDNVNDFYRLHDEDDS